MLQFSVVQKMSVLAFQLQKHCIRSSTQRVNKFSIILKAADEIVTTKYNYHITMKDRALRCIQIEIKKE